MTSYLFNRNSLNRSSKVEILRSRARFFKDGQSTTAVNPRRSRFPPSFNTALGTGSGLEDDPRLIYVAARWTQTLNDSQKSTSRQALHFIRGLLYKTAIYDSPTNYDIFNANLVGFSVGSIVHRKLIV